MMSRLAVGILALTLATSPLAASAKVECPDLSSSQLKTLQKTWRYGEKKMGAGWGVKLAALAYQESELGLKKHGRGSYGTFQLKPRTASELAGKKVTRKQLIQNHALSAELATDYLTFWKEKGLSDSKVFSHYNAGYKTNVKSRKYAKSVHKNVKILQQCYVYRNGVIHAKNNTG